MEWGQWAVEAENPFNFWQVVPTCEFSLNIFAS